LLGRRGGSCPANASGFDTHRASITSGFDTYLASMTSRFGQVEGRQSANPRTGAVVPLTVLRAIHQRLAPVLRGV
jgi:hypothetical protein